MSIRRFFSFVFLLLEKQKIYPCVSKLKSEMKKRAGHSFVLLNLMNSFYMCCIKDKANLIFASKREPKKGRETLTVKPFRSPVSGWNKEMLVFPPLTLAWFLTL